jgi:transposase
VKRRGHMIETLFRFVAALDTSDGRTVREIMRRTGMGQRRVYRWLEAGMQAGAVKRLPGGPAHE